jgi:hypothetical protein
MGFDHDIGGNVGFVTFVSFEPICADESDLGRTDRVSQHMWRNDGSSQIWLVCAVLAG